MWFKFNKANVEHMKLLPELISLLPGSFHLSKLFHIHTTVQAKNPVLLLIPVVLSLPTNHLAISSVGSTSKIYPKCGHISPTLLPMTFLNPSHVLFGLINSFVTGLPTSTTALYTLFMTATRCCFTIINQTHDSPV